MIEEKNDLMKNISGNDNKNLRKYLILGGGVFVLFVIGIVISKFIFSAPKKDDTKVILPAEMKTDTNLKDTKLFNDIPIENDANNDSKEKQASVKEEFKKPEIKPQTIKKEKEIVKEEKKSEKIEAKPVETKKVSQPAKTTPKAKPKKELTKEYYLQVAAVTRGKPSPKFLELIKKNGFNYKILEVEIKGKKVRRVLVGPFTYEELKKALPKVKQKISSSAFVKRIK